MALAKSLIPILFQGGLDQKTAPKLSVPGSFAALENIVRRKTGQLEKRYGVTSLPKTTTAGGTISAATGLTSYNNELILTAADGVYSYSESQQKWAKRSSVVPVGVERAKISGAPSGSVTYFDLAYGDGVFVALVRDSTFTLRLYVIDEDSGNVTQITSVSASRVIYNNGTFYGFVQSGSSVYVSTALSSAPTTWTSAVVAKTGTGSQFDVGLQGSNLVLMCGLQTSNFLHVTYLKSDGTAGGVANGLPGNAYTGSGTQTVTSVPHIVCDNTNGKLWALFHSTGVTRLVALTANLATSVEAVVRASAASTTTISVTGAVGTGGALAIYESINMTVPATGNEVRVGAASWPGSGAITITTPVMKHGWAAAATRAFSVNGQAYCILNFRRYGLTVTTEIPDPVSIAGFIVDSAGAFVAFVNNYDLNYTGTASAYSLPNVPTDGTGRCAAILQSVPGTPTSSGGSNGGWAVDLFKMDFNGTHVPTQQVGKNLYFGGGSLLMYDGAEVVEAGFTTPPVMYDAVLGAAYSIAFALTFQWTDAQGQLHESAPTPRYTLTQLPSTITIKSLQATRKSNVKIALYTTEHDEPSGLMYLRQTYDNVATAVTQTIAFSTPGTNQYTLLYTTGGILDNVPSLPAQHITSHRERLWAGGLLESDQLWFSKYVVSGEPVHMNDTNVLAIETQGGPVVAIGSLDDKLVIFKRRRIYANFGQGPLDTGSQSDFQTPLLVTNDLGCTEARSVVSTPTGILFKSEKGIYMLSRGLAPSFVGAAVEDYNDETITSAVLIPDQNEVRFTTEAGPCLVYNYLFGTWSTFTNYAATGAVAIGTTYYHCKSDGTVCKEIVGQYDDDGDDIPMAIETGWLSMAGIQSYQRVYKFLLLGDLESDHTTRVKIAYDFENTYNETIDFPTATNLTTSNFQVDVRPARQKCESIKLRIEDIDAAGGASFKLVAMTVQVGRKSGANKLPASQKAGNG